MSNWQISRLKAVALALAAAWPGGATENGDATVESASAGTAWAAWRAGDFADAQARAIGAIERGVNVDEARHVLALVAHLTGRHADAVAAYGAIGERYRRLSELDEPILWSYLRLGRRADAHAFAHRRGLSRSRATRERLRMAAERPMHVEISGVVELPFTSDAFSPLMPGVDVQLQGQPLVARLDTGGSYVHVTQSQARALGIKYRGCERGFAGLVARTICYGTADLDLAGARLRNVPISVHADAAVPIAAIARAFGVDMGPIIGTNVFRQFLTTIDAPGNRLILCRRGDPAASAEHLARLSGSPDEVPFAVLGEHYMIARGRIGTDRDLSFFIDSGLAIFTTDQGQAAMLVSRGTLEAWGLPQPASGRFAEIPQSIALGSVAQNGTTAFVVPDRTWRAFGDWSGIRVDALLSHAFLKKYAWTIDFDRRVYAFRGG
jgi:hypothetical protein